MVVSKVSTNPDIYNIKVALAGNPLRDLNVYVIVSNGEALVIDTGFHTEACRKDLLDGLQELKIPMSNIALFLTHMHSDHAGQADIFTQAGCKVYMNRIDIPWLKGSITGKTRIGLEQLFLRNGYPKDDMKKDLKTNPMFAYAPLEDMELMPVDDGTILNVGNITAECVWTGGHTPGHTCLYLKEYGILFAGDHILYDITPNICAWTGVKDSLGDYLRNLDKVDKLRLDVVYPAHRELSEEPHERIKTLISHHKKRLGEITRIVREYPGITAYVLTSKMKWSIRCNSWEDFPANQKWFAMGEVLAHLDWLRLRNYVKVVEDMGMLKVYLA